jgi:hypothetical protein
MECADMPTELERIVQLVCSTSRRNETCRRGVCRRYGYCLPPRVRYNRRLFRCPFDADDTWPRRHAIVEKLAERLIKAGEAGCATRGVPSPFAPEPVPDHLDLTRPFDAAALLAAEKEAYAEMKAAAVERPY